MVVVGTPTELKQKAMKGELLLVEAAPLGPAVEALQTAPGVLDVGFRQRVAPGGAAG
jgi:hypothetical protein